MRNKVFTILIAGIMVFCQNLIAQLWEKTIRLTWNSSTSSSPKIAADSFSDLHLVWEDNSTGNYEIFYKKGVKK